MSSQPAASDHALPIVPQITSDPLLRYAFQMLELREPEAPLDAILKEMEEVAAAERIPIIGAVQGAIVQVLVSLRRRQSQRVLEIGTAIGYSTLWLARGMGPQGKLLTIEIDQVRAARARVFIARAGYADRIEVLQGDVFEIMPVLEGQFDIIFQDVIKHAYFSANAGLATRLLELSLAALADDGILLGDNAYCMGEVLDQHAIQEYNQVAGIDRYNRAVASHSQLESVIVPVRDGMWVSRKRTAEER